MKRHVFILASLLGQSLLGQSGQGQIFRVEPVHSKVYTVTYRSADELAAKALQVARSQLLSDSSAGSVPKGGELTVIVRGTTIYSANPKNYAVIVLDEQGREIVRTNGSDVTPEPTSHGWLGAIVIGIPEQLGNLSTVYVVNTGSGYREEFRIRRG
jgi:hypothetical protein